jgi:hypothetical protein
MPRYRKDSDGSGPTYKKGDRVWVAPLKMEATVIKQILHYDGPETFYGNVQVKFDDGTTGTGNCWQMSKVVR